MYNFSFDYKDNFQNLNCCFEESYILFSVDGPCFVVSCFNSWSSRSLALYTLD